MLPDDAPVAAGAYLAVKDELCPAARVKGRVKPEILNPVPEAVAAETTTLADPPFVSVTV